MTTTFNYSPKKISMARLGAALAGVALIVIPQVYPIGFRKGSLTISPKVVMILFTIVGLAILVYSIIGMITESKLRKVAEPIIIDGEKVTFMKAGLSKVEKKEFSLSHVESVKLDTEDNVFEVRTNEGNFKFDGSYFDSKERFNEFMQLFSK